MTTTNVVQLSSITPHPSVEYWSVCKVEALFETPFFRISLSCGSSASRAF